jgi:hypothetical protein
MIMYLTIGIIWTISFDWFIKSFGPKPGEGIPTLRGFLLHTFLWPLMIIVLIINLNKD